MTQNAGVETNNANAPLSQVDKLKAELATAVKEERFLDADRIAKQIAALNKGGN